MNKKSSCIRNVVSTFKCPWIIGNFFNVIMKTIKNLNT